MNNLDRLRELRKLKETRKNGSSSSETSNQTPHRNTPPAGGSMQKAISEILQFLGPEAKYDIDKGLISLRRKIEGKTLRDSGFAAALEVLGKIKHPERFPPEEILFFDIETSGTSGSAGITIFMFGCGTFQNGDFYTERIFMPQPSRTLEMMKAIREIFRGKKLILSFNGKAFDLNLIKDKMAMIRLEEKPDFDEMDHFDLLYTGRRLFKKLLASCALSSIEKNILNIQRTEDDIPGYLIPFAYSQFLHEHLSGDIKNIFYHNELDIISLLDLVNYFSDIMASPLDPAYQKDDLELARLLNKTDPVSAEKIYQFILTEKYPEDLKWTARVRLSLLYKTTDTRAQAVNVWNEMLKNRILDLFPFIELAKHFEHTEKDLKLALEYMRKAEDFLSRSVRLGAKESNPSILADMTKRIQRLKKKLTGKRTDLPQ